MASQHLICDISWHLRLVRFRTAPFHGANMSSNLIGVTMGI
nr:MAG TPA: hypothetical protein [Caudoviricetes sp.]